MKSTLLSTILFICILFNANAQNFFLLNNGEKIEYKKYKIKDKDFTVEINKPKPAIIKIKDIDYLVNSKGEIRYLKPKLNKDQVVSAYGFGEYLNPDFVEMEKHNEGKISIYFYTINTGSRTLLYSFLEKGDVFAQIFNPEMFEGKKKDNKKNFSKYFSDDKEIYNQLMDGDFKANVKNVLELIRKYNIRSYDKLSNKSDDDTAKAIIYRSYKAEELVADIEVNGQKITLANMNYKRVKLPDNVPVKICINNGETEYCDLISGSKHIEKYFEIQLKPDGDIEIEIRNTKQFGRYINALNDSY